MSNVKMGRPPLPPGERKIKINVAVDSDIFAFLQTTGNRSEFINKAARILMKAVVAKNASPRK